MTNFVNSFNETKPFFHVSRSDEIQLKTLFDGFNLFSLQCAAPFVDPPESCPPLLWIQAQCNAGIKGEAVTESSKEAAVLEAWV